MGYFLLKIECSELCSPRHGRHRFMHRNKHDVSRTFNVIKHKKFHNFPEDYKNRTGENLRTQ